MRPADENILYHALDAFAGMPGIPLHGAPSLIPLPIWPGQVIRRAWALQRAAAYGRVEAIDLLVRDGIDLELRQGGRSGLLRICEYPVRCTFIGVLFNGCPYCPKEKT